MECDAMSVSFANGYGVETRVYEGKQEFEVHYKLNITFIKNVNAVSLDDTIIQLNNTDWTYEIFNQIMESKINNYEIKIEYIA